MDNDDPFNNPYDTITAEHLREYMRALERNHALLRQHQQPRYQTYERYAPWMDEQIRYTLIGGRAAGHVMRLDPKQREVQVPILTDVRPPIWEGPNDAVESQVQYEYDRYTQRTFHVEKNTLHLMVHSEIPDFAIIPHLLAHYNPKG